MQKSDFTEEAIRHANIMERNFGDSYPIGDENMTVEDYQKVIDDYEQKFGERYFEENEGMFWGIHETRPYMQCLLDQGHLLWESGERERAIDQYKYMLKLNPNDNQGVRDTLLPNLLELNRLDEAEDLYLEYEDDYSASWKFGKLLLDIKRNTSFDEIKMQYKKCIEYNPYIVDYLLGEKRIPAEMPFFYGFGDENEAIYYVLLSAEAWYSDIKSMKVLMELSENSVLHYFLINPLLFFNITKTQNICFINRVTAGHAVRIGRTYLTVTIRTKSVKLHIDVINFINFSNIFIFIK